MPRQTNTELNVEAMCGPSGCERRAKGTEGNRARRISCISTDATRAHTKLSARSRWQTPGTCFPWPAYHGRNPPGSESRLPTGIASLYPIGNLIYSPFKWLEKKTGSSALACNAPMAVFIALTMAICATWIVSVASHK